MNRCVHSLLWLGLGLCTASGCALSAPGRSGANGPAISLRDESLTGNAKTAQSMTSNNEVDVRATRSSRDSTSRGIVSFRSPFRSESSLHESPLASTSSPDQPVNAAGHSRRDDLAEALARDESQALSEASSTREQEPGKFKRGQRENTLATLSLAGHSSDQTTDLRQTDVQQQENGLPSRTHVETRPTRLAEARENSANSVENEIAADLAGSLTQVRYVAIEIDRSAFQSGAATGDERSIELVRVTEEVPGPGTLTPDQVVGNGIRTANYLSDQDGLPKPVELQGLETFAPLASTTTGPPSPPLWSSRPEVRSLTQPGSRVQLEQPTQHSEVHLRRPTLFANETVHSASSGDSQLAPQRAGRAPAPLVQPVSSRAAPPLPPSPWQSELDQLTTRIERDLQGMSPGLTVAAQAEYRRRQVHLRLLYLIAQRPEQALTAIPGLEANEREYWQQLCWAASNSLDAEQFPQPRDRAAQSIAPLSTALRRLREQADLSIKNTAFCEQISYFGNYQKFARDEFTPGQEVLLYAEIENFNTDQTHNGEHRTLLRSVIDIIGANGETRWHKTFPATEDRCRNPRRDYFHNYQFAIPDRLPLGPHTLKLTVVDDLSGKQASYSLRFLVK